MSNDCPCRCIGGAEESVMGMKSTWVVEWSLEGQIWTTKVLAYDIKGAIEEWLKPGTIVQGIKDQRFILGVRKE